MSAYLWNGIFLFSASVNYNEALMCIFIGIKIFSNKEIQFWSSDLKKIKIFQWKNNKFIIYLNN